MAAVERLITINVLKFQTENINYTKVKYGETFYSHNMALIPTVVKIDKKLAIVRGGCCREVDTINVLKFQTENINYTKVKYKETIYSHNMALIPSVVKIDIKLAIVRGGCCRKGDYDKCPKFSNIKVSDKNAICKQCRPRSDCF